MPDSRRPEHEIGVLFEAAAASNRVGLLLNKVFGDLGLKPVGYAILSILATTGDATPTELARVLGSPPSTLSGHMADLRSRDWINREEGEDRRVSVLTLTAAGAEVHTAAEKRTALAVARLRRELTVPEETVRHVLHDLADSMDRTTATW